MATHPLFFCMLQGPEQAVRAARAQRCAQCGGVLAGPLPPAQGWPRNRGAARRAVVRHADRNAAVSWCLHCCLLSAKAVGRRSDAMLTQIQPHWLAGTPMASQTR